MSVIAELIRVEEGKSLSFGDYLAKEKKKVSGFTVDGDVYKVKTHHEITKLEKNGKLLLESVPGSTIHGLKVTEEFASFSVESFKDVDITMELAPEQEYKILIGNEDAGTVRSNVAGKISFGVEVNEAPTEIKIEKI